MVLTGNKMLLLDEIVKLQSEMLNRIDALEIKNRIQEQTINEILEFMYNNIKSNDE